MKRSGPTEDLDVNTITSANGKSYVLIYGQPLGEGVEGPTAFIGKGAFGTITIAMTTDGTPLAAKLLTLDRRDNDYPALRAEIEKECAIMQHLGREADLIEVKSEDPNKVMLYVMQPYIRGIPLALFFKQLIDKSQTPELKNNDAAKVLLLNEAISAFIAAIEATQALHAKGVIHGDLHNGNILYSPATKLAKAIDFGLSYILPSGKKRVYDSSEVKITNMHRAPETVIPAMHRQGRGLERVYDRSSDGYSLGIDFCVDFEFSEYLAPAIANQEVVALMKIFKELSQEKQIGGTGRIQDRISLAEALQRLKVVQDRLEMRIIQERLFEIKSPVIQDIATKYQELNTFKEQARKAGLPADIKGKIKELAKEMQRRREVQPEPVTPRAKAIAHHHAKERNESDSRAKLKSSLENRDKKNTPPARL